ncbi:MAG: MFS transporter, partial [Stackebrandtia sp.]
APLVDRVPKQRLAAIALIALGAASLIGAAGHLVTLAVFSLLVGAAIAVLNPALSAEAADRFPDGPSAGRAATLVTAFQSLTAMLAAPIVALPALLWGWQGDLTAVTVVSVVLACVLLVRGGAWDRRGEPTSPETSRPGYFATFKKLARIPGAVPLVLIGSMRSAAFMGYLAYLAAFYGERFGLRPEVFALVWTVSGTSFFFGNLLTGRWANSGGRLSPERVLVCCLVAVLAAMTGFFFVESLPLAVALTAILGAGHASVAACVVTLLVRRCGDLRGAALSLNAAGMSLGIFAGAALGGVGLGLAEYPGAAAVFVVLTAVPLALAYPAIRDRLQ